MFKRIVVALATIGAASVLAAPAQAVTCTPTDYTQDGRPLTAALINPPNVSGTLDATGCDIGVYYNAGAHTINHATIQNAFYYGVLARNPGTSVDVSNSSEVKFIGDVLGGTFFPTGAQHGVGIAYREQATGSVDDTYVHQYQKNGFVVKNPGTRVTVTNSHVQGLGPTPLIAQNGIQYSDGSSGVVRDNLIEDNEYTGSGTFSTGLLLYDVNPFEIKRSLNLYRNNDRNEVVIPSKSLK